MGYDIETVVSVNLINDFGLLSWGLWF